LTVLDEWDITAEQLTQLLNENPSLRGMLLGYVAELKLREIIASFPEVSLTRKFDDHDRKRKGDLYIIYRGKAFDVESKSLQTATVEWNETNKQWTGKAQVDASDRRQITMPDGTQLNTTLLLKGEFDILAVNCYAFEQKWDFIFAKNSDLPASTWRGYSETQRENLIASLIPVTFPPKPPFYSDLRVLLDKMIAEGRGSNPIDLDLKE
jgi:hypothetical protein